MAEKYGEIPPLFTKKWWEFFWDYYKIHTIVVVCILLAIGITIHQVSTRVEYDINVVIGTYSHITDESLATLRSGIEEHMEDVDNNGEKNALVVYNGFSDEVEQGEYTRVLEARFMLNLQEDNSFVFIVDKKASSMLLDLDYCDEMYLNAGELGQADVEGLKDRNGICYGIPLKDSTILKESNINCDDLYLVLRKNFKEDQLTKKAFDTSLNLAKELIK